MKTIILRLAIVLVTISSLGQGKQPLPESAFNLFPESSVTAAEKTYTQVTDGDLLSIDLSELSALREAAPNQFQLTIPMSDGQPMVLELEKIKIFTDEFKVETSTGRSMQNVDLGVHYKGTIPGQSRSYVSLSVYKDEVVGLFSDSQYNYELVKLKNNASRYIFYKTANLQEDIKKDLFKFECHMEAGGKDMPVYTDAELNNANRALDCQVVQVYLVADYSYYLLNDSDADETTNKMTSAFAQTINAYNAEDIYMVLSGVFVWDSQDTFIESDDTGDQRDDFRAYYNGDGAGWPGDLAALISGQTGSWGGGIAYFDGLCTNDSYSLTRIGIDAPILPWTSYTRYVKVLTHEIGHNLNSRHTHACVWNGDSTQIDDYGNTTSAGVATDDAEGGSCLSEPYLLDVFPTIMSYFDSYGHGTFPISNGMGTQPGNVMRNYVSNASCLTNGNAIDPIVVCRDITIQLDTNGNATVTAAAIDNGSYDACGGTPSLSLSQTNFNCSDLGTNVVTLTATDSSGNDSSCTATVIVEDNINPIITCPSSRSIKCDESTLPANTGLATAADNCDVNPDITYTDVANLTGCGGTGTITRTWRATDASGNTTSCVQTITLVDNEGPDITCPPDLNVECGSDYSPAATGTATATDKCDLNPTVTYSDVTNLDGCGDTGTITRTWTATDACNNETSCVQVITIIDTTAPTAICQDITIQLGDNESVSITPSQIDNGSNDICGNVTLAIDQSVFTCYMLGEHIVKLTVTDECNNASTCSAIVTLEGPDEDCDTVADQCDECPGGDDTIDNNGDGLPDCAYFPGFDNLIDEWVCGNKEKKVVLCHRSKGSLDSPQTICVAESAVEAHLAHGDYLGPCDDANCDDVEAKFESSSLMQLTVLPNPVKDKATISIKLPPNSSAQVDIYNLVGQRVYGIQTGTIASGSTEIAWDGTSANGKPLPSGIYYVILKSNGKIITEKIILK
ncbi:MAG: T9SS type A sorting domain-containing protein [Algicola sp.]|nr:T9SS type A sorting domain-containing protein [Algicola sp.]